MEIIQVFLTVLLFVVLVVPMGTYLFHVLDKKKTFADKLFDPIDNFIYKITGINDEEMNWKQYAVSLLLTNLVVVVLVYILFRIQGLSGVKGMRPDLAFNTAISFITNTNLQNYSGETELSIFTQMAAITFLMFIAAATGIAAVSAFARGISGKSKTMGNYFVDLVRTITRILMPLSVVIALLLVTQGVPQTFMSKQVVSTIEGKSQVISMGPVASLESIKHLGTNGGGFFSANSAHPFENPTPFSNLIEILSMMLIPGALAYSFGLLLKNKKQGWSIFIAMMVFFVTFLAICCSAEMKGNPLLLKAGLSQSMGNMEGKEVRFGAAQSSLFTTVSTAFTTGSVNSALDSLMPMGGFAALGQMMLNVIFGGDGVGLMNMLMYAILTVFLCGLMVGRTPEFLGKKIEGREIKLVAIAILIHPFIIMIPTAVALLEKAGVGSVSNPGFHGLTQILYQYTTAAANNGSSFAGLSTKTPFWNVTTGFVMFIGRYFSIMLLLAVSGSLASKRMIPVTTGTLKTDDVVFTCTLIAVVLIIGALTFFPAIALGPVAEQLTLGY